ncbi:flavin monoamine oxidase family protein [Alkalihalophilus sp. As8PL]|uniref:Flavin monoamine oxidase family protein n=1 Tax=Alkalihalophilus sp. As8PL TaxID=3237103 RepID=A0AB39BTL4_9BACI
MTTIYDVVIIGAGLAGLSAANGLHDKGLNYKVIEASARAGGKVRSFVGPDGARSFELGAQFVNKDMDQIGKWVQRAGLELLETKSGNDTVGISFPSKEIISDAVCQHEKQFEEIQAKLQSTDERLSDLLRRLLLTKTENQIITSIYAERINIDPQKVSARGLLDRTFRFESEENDMTHQVNAPLSELITFMERNIAENIAYEEPVVRIEKNSEGYKIISTKQTYMASAIIIAVPPTVASRLEYEESLEQHYRKALDSYLDGSIIKTTWVFDDPFWHEYKVQSQARGVHDVVFTDPQGVTVIESSKVGGQYRLTMYIGASAALDLAKKARAERINTATSMLVEVFGEKAKMYEDVEQSVWVEDKLCGGGYGACLRYGALLNAAEVLRTPKDKMVFASSELAERFPYYMEGAILAGMTAASGILND